jgi:hypothetical protein
MRKHNGILTMVAERGLTPAEVVDYTAVDVAGRTQKAWASERGLGGHQSVGRNVRAARKKLKDPRNIIDTVVVDPDDVIEALRFNGRPPEYKNQVSAVIRIEPPFETESGTSIGHTEEGNYYPSEMNPKPIHINPRVFVAEDVIDQPIRSDERARAKDVLDDPTEEEIEEFVDMSFEVWESEVRNRIKTEADINDSELQHGGPHMVEVLNSS